MSSEQKFLLALVAVMGAALVHPAAAWLGLGLLPYYRIAGQVLTRALYENSLALPLGYLVALGGALAFRTATPTDDLLRHVVSHAYGYSHQAMYPLSTLPSYNLYPLFDHFMGYLASKGLEPLQVVRLAQLSAWGLCLNWAWRVIAGELRDSDPDRYLKQALLLGLLFATPVSVRLVLARPEIFVMVWAAYALLVRTPAQLAGWLVAGLLACGSYWMAFLAFPFVLLLQRPLKTKIAAGAGLTLAHFAFWNWYSQGAYFETLAQVPQWNANRLIAVSENASAFTLLLLPAFTALACAAVAGVQVSPQGWRHPRVRLTGLLIGAYALLLGMVRYVSAYVFALLPFAARALRDVALPTSPILRTFLLLAPFYLALFTGSQAQPLEALPRFALPPHSRVLTTFGVATFAVPFSSATPVEVLPAMEIGASTQAVQRTVSALGRGDAQCAVWKQLGVTHVVERSLRVLPDCATLRALQGEWRLWEVSHD